MYWTDKIVGYSNFPERLRNIRTVDDAVDQFLAGLPPLKTLIAAKRTEEDLSILQAVLEKYIGDNLNKWSASEDLYADCLEKADGEQIDDRVASAVMLDQYTLSNLECGIIFASALHSIVEALLERGHPVVI